MSHVEHGLDAEALFDKQVETYAQLGFTAVIGTEVFETLKPILLENLNDLSKPSFFSLAIPHIFMPLNQQLELAGSRAFLKRDNMVDIEDWDHEPTQPYAVIDVDDGEDYRGMSAEVADAKIMASGRHSFNIDELVSLGVHAPQLWTPPRRGLYAAATLHPEEGQMASTLDLYRFGDGGLKVKRDPGIIRDSDWTTPSYQARVIVA
ncbi:MAG TPA: hypothetical protein VHB51_01705 [Candidatus Saccharimonadales bacterium]|nr:hypothetical protein [Candidatus Saccharimonadales bacterium]